MTSDVQAAREPGDVTSYERKLLLQRIGSYGDMPIPLSYILIERLAFSATGHRFRSDEDREVDAFALEALIAASAERARLLSALTAAEERAATAERELAEARALAAERLEALRPFANDYDEAWSPEANDGYEFENCTSLDAGSTDLTVGDLRRAAVLTSGADHGG